MIKEKQVKGRPHLMAKKIYTLNDFIANFIPPFITFITG